jgi:hypothetical protein
MDLLTVDDLTPFATIDDDKAEAMIADAIALATQFAPCLTSDEVTDAQLAAAKAVLRAAVLRWNDTGTGAVTSQTAGPYGQTVDTRQPRRTLFWPSEITALQRICQGADDGSAFAVDTAAAPQVVQPTSFGGWHSMGAWNDVGQFIPGNYF